MKQAIKQMEVEDKKTKCGHIKRTECQSAISITDYIYTQKLEQVEKIGNECILGTCGIGECTDAKEIRILGKIAGRKKASLFW